MPGAPNIRAAVLGGARRFSLPAFMASQSAGFWYDFTRSDTMFQEDVGPTPADEPNEVIGLALSQRLWGGQTRTGYLAGQPDLAAAYGDMGSATGWTLSSSWAISGGSLNKLDSGTGDASYTAAGLTPGRLYYCEFSATAAVNVRNGTQFVSTTSVGAGRRVAYFTATASNTGFQGGALGLVIDDLTIKEVSQVPATQSATSFKVKYQLVGATGDGTDDRARTNYAAGSGENFLMLPATTVPVTLAGTQVLAGAMDGSANGAYVAITAGGTLRVKWGSTTLDSTGVDLRNGAHDLGFWTDNGTLYLFADGVVVGSGAWTGTIPTTTWNLWALNNNGTASNFFAGSLTAALAGREAINLARAIQICANA